MLLAEELRNPFVEELGSYRNILITSTGACILEDFIDNNRWVSSKYGTQVLASVIIYESFRVGLQNLDAVLVFWTAEVRDFEIQTRILRRSSTG
jgi:uncharacterized membrane-anchored protein